MKFDNNFFKISIIGFLWMYLIFYAILGFTELHDMSSPLSTGTLLSAMILGALFSFCLVTVVAYLKIKNRLKWNNILFGLALTLVLFAVINKKLRDKGYNQEFSVDYFSHMDFYNHGNTIFFFNALALAISFIYISIKVNTKAN